MVQNNNQIFLNFAADLKNWNKPRPLIPVTAECSVTALVHSGKQFYCNGSEYVTRLRFGLFFSMGLRPHHMTVKVAMVVAILFDLIETPGL